MDTPDTEMEWAKERALDALARLLAGEMRHRPSIARCLARGVTTRRAPT
jgi:hypothetical protein